MTMCKHHRLTSFQALGAGLIENYDNQLTEAPEEEGEFDVLNDETFGDFGDGESIQIP